VSDEVEFDAALFVEAMDRLDYGILRKSGRYPWGSGDDVYTRSQDFDGYVKQLKASGLADKEIAVVVGLSVADLRDARSIAKEEIVAEQTSRAINMRDRGVSIEAISADLGIPQPTVRLRLKNSEEEKKTSLRSTADIVRKNVDEHQIVDIGSGVGLQMGISKERLRAAVSVLRDEGYETYTLPVRQPGTKNMTNQKVIVPPGTGFGNARRMTDNIHTMGEWTEDDGKTFFGIHEPISINSKRLQVNFSEDGGSKADGVVFVRPGVKDLDMGKNRYAQVRIAVDGTHFIKGMAVIKDDLPAGVDLVFNTNKSKSVGKIGALKPLKDDPDNPFGSVIKRQIVDIDPKSGKERIKSAINIVNEEGDWDTWSNSLPSQMLAKQPHSLIKSQLDVTRQSAKDRLAEIDAITNPVVRKKTMEDFADQIDSDAVDLRAASLPRQRTQVIIPMPKMNKGEIYAPNFETGESVVLIRYPHGGRFEIPEVIVNNNNRTAKKLLGNAVDAIGIHPSVAEKLSGADFDGDTVVVIPNRTGKIKGSASMGSQAKVYEDGLKTFDAKRQYGGFVQSGTDAQGRKIGNFPLMKNTGLEMGKITNLITDMSIQGAKPEHVVRAVKHSMVVIDAEKHDLNWKQSEVDNGITQLKTLYQGSGKAGATTLLSQATARNRIPERKARPHAEGGPIDKSTGEKKFVPTGKTNNKFDRKTGLYTDEKTPKLESIKRLELTDNAFSLVRDKSDPVERLYADHANMMKELANTTRLKAARVQVPPRNTQARKVYKDEVDKLDSDLRAALKQAPLDRKAQVYANVQIKMKRQEDPTLRDDRDRMKKVERQALAGARSRLGLSKPTIEISDRQWDAIQSGAVSPSKLREILRFADSKRVQELSIPRTNVVVTKAIGARAAAMLAAGATNADVARALGISASTLREAVVRGDV
jgi:hypothetical protein